MCNFESKKRFKSLKSRTKVKRNGLFRFDLFERLSSFLAKSGDLTAAVIQEIGPEKYQEFCGVVDKHRVSKTVFLRENIVANIGLFHRIR